MILSKNAKRLGIFFFFDKDGVVDDYVSVLLDDMSKNLSELFVVCNGKLTDEGRRKLERTGATVYVRKNVGFDVWAYKEALEHYGWEALEKFDEVILFNFTIFGPFYPFREMFDAMDQKDVDFWGITTYNGAPVDIWGKTGLGYLPKHLQSHFIAVRRPMLSSRDFHNYWKKMRPVESYEDAICYHEAIFTKTFADKGYRWQSYVDTDDLDETTTYPLLMMPVELVKNRRCPIIKRRSFFLDTLTYLNETFNENAYELFCYIKDHTQYNIDLIWDNLLRTCNQSDLKNSLHFDYVLPSCCLQNPGQEAKKRKVALVMHLYLPSLIPYCRHYAASMPEETDVYITTDTEEKKALIQKAFGDLACHKLEIRVIGNRGRDVSALLVGCRDVLMNYDYVCFTHDKSPRNVDVQTVGISFSYICYEAVLKNRLYVENILDLFDKNPRIGLLTPPPPNHGDYYPIVGAEWTLNFDNCRKLAKDLGIHVDMTKKKPPVAPLGTIFWFRPKAMKPLIEHEWKYEDFPKEPVKQDGTLLHAVERLYPFAVQSQGYYPAWVMPETLAQICITNQYYYVRSLNIACLGDKLDIHRNMLAEVEKMRTELKFEDIFRVPAPPRARILIGIRMLMPIRVYNFLRKIKRRLFGTKTEEADE